MAESLEPEFCFLTTTHAYRFLPSPNVHPNLFDDYTMADTQKDALFKKVQIDALVRRKSAKPVPHCAPRHCARKTAS